MLRGFGCNQALGTLPVQSPGLSEAGFSVQDKSGLFWVSDQVRTAAAAAIGSGTTFITVEDPGVTQFGTAYQGGSGADWVSGAVASGRAVLVRPMPTYAAPAMGVILTTDPYRIAYNAARSFEGNFAILAAPAALITRALNEVSQGPRGAPTDYSGGSEPGAALPNWLLPAIVGVGVVAVIAFMRSGK